MCDIVYIALHACLQLAFSAGTFRVEGDCSIGNISLDDSVVLYINLLIVSAAIFNV